MRVLVLSDTHVPTLARRLPEVILQQGLNCEAIIHAGDFVSKSVIDQLVSLNTLYAVHGNQDSPSVSRILPFKRVVELARWKVGIVHGHSGQGMYTEERAYNSFLEERVDIVVFGHSHQPLNVEREGVRMFNPGSPVAGRSSRGNTYGLLELDSSISASIVSLGR